MRIGHEDVTVSASQLRDGVLTRNRSPPCCKRHANRGTELVRCGLAIASAARPAAPDDHTLLRERSQARRCRARAARTAHRDDRDRARDRHPAHPCPARGCPADPCPPALPQPPLDAGTHHSPSLIRWYVSGTVLPPLRLSGTTRRLMRPDEHLAATDRPAASRPPPNTTPEKARAAFRRPSIPVASVGFGRGASCLAAHPEAGRPAARNARPLRSAMAIPQWVSGTRLYPLVPPLPVLLESVTSGPPPFRGKPECIPGLVDDGNP